MIQSNELNRKPLVLVVEDQEINRDLLGMILGDSYDVIYAENGEEALELIRDNEDKLSVILLDLIMPVMDGFEVLEALGGDEELKRIPVIVLTAEKEAELRALRLGAVDFITKPFDLHEVILARIERIIELSEGRQLIRSAERDRLTGLYARSFFYEYAERIFRYHRDWHMDAVVIDINKFHTINELHGRDFGDEVLCTIAGDLERFTAGSGGISSRLEADRFAMFCRHRELLDYEALVAAIQNSLDELPGHANIRISMGVMPYMEGAEPADMITCAKRACKMVRSRSDTQIEVYDEEMMQKEIYQQRLLNDVNWAIDSKQFTVFYQPKYDIQCDPPKLSSAEALVRWNHPEFGMISPGDFIPLFEQNGMIHMVDDYVWAVAAKQIADWRERFGIVLPLSVNMSRVEMFNPELKETLGILLKYNHLDPENLKLEVTESAYTDNAEELIAVIEKLRAEGFEIEMDDFGAGYSSLNMLSSLPIDVLKMDMKFIRNVEKDARNFRMIELVLDIARYLGVPVVAEGVETEAQMKLLRDAGCELVQGYYFSKPLPPEEFEELIKKEIAIER
jgi:diguanylate cyclase (GGDEF)-like protein